MTPRLPPHCALRDVDIGAKKCFEFEITCAKRRAGVIQACQTKHRRRVVYSVTDVHVHPDFRRKGIATALYEAAAQEACRRRSRLASTARNMWAHSYAFWLKQVQKGRAQRYAKRPPWPRTPATEKSSSDWATMRDVFILDCDKASDLSGVYR